MPFIDLSSPTNPVGSTNAGNDLSGIPQGFVQTPVVNAQIADDSNVLPTLNTSGSNTLPPIEGLGLSAKPVEIATKTQNTGNNEEHILMRNIPEGLDINPTIEKNGVKEFIGPSLNGVNNLNDVGNIPAQENKPPVELNKVALPEIKKEIKVESKIIEEKALTDNLLEEKVNISGSTIDKLLDLVVQKEASDLHLAVGFPPTLRFDGKLIGVGKYDLTADDIKTMLSSLLDKRLQDELLRNLDVDFSITHKSGSRFRVNIFWSKGTMAAAFRYISSKIRSIGELGLPAICYDLIKRPHGLILLTGPTGSGKSTSIAAMIQEINVMEAKHIVTIEDPVEYIFPRAKSLVNQREIGNDASGWKRSLRELLRQDPNVVVVGEMRDYETIASTITVAETGHLVFATLHTNSASQTIDRIIDVFPDVQQPQIRAQLAVVINAVVSQRLVQLNGGGRKAVFEVMIATPAIKNAIREGKTYQIDNIIQTSLDMGMITLEKSLVQLIRNGELSIEMAKEYTNKPDELDSLLKGN